MEGGILLCYFPTLCVNVPYVMTSCLNVAAAAVPVHRESCSLFRRAGEKSKLSLEPTTFIQPLLFNGIRFQFGAFV